jgi:ribosomal-protein-alanine N-acetyltransferase
MASLITLDTPRLRLRPWRETDLDAFAALNADPEVMEYFPARLTPTESDAMAARIATFFEQRGYGFWAVEEKGGDPFVGFIGLAVPRHEMPFMPCVEIGWRLARKYWGRGYAQEGARASLAFAFENLKLDEVVAFTSAINERSWRVMDAIGMKRAHGEDFNHPALPGEHRLQPHILYRISRADWQALNKS